MSAPRNNDKYVMAMFDSYAKTVMRNACRNILKSERTRQQHEIIGTAQLFVTRL